mmetsp:Transcript_64060/g.169718  ORF Transcript_64060/g.169718 Transcript_64060/m.169718 type:complete len:249 (-) Transcript_64060:71-817(-)
MGGATSAESRVTKQQAMAAVAEAFRGKASASSMSIRDIVVAGCEQNSGWSTSNHSMNQWQQGARPQVPPPALAPATPPAESGPDWVLATEGGTMTRDTRMSKIRTLFSSLDSDGSHIVDREEFVTGMRAQGMDPREAADLFAEMDASRTGHLTVAKFDHFVAMQTLTMVKNVFKNLDDSHDRQIDKTEFKTYFMNNGLSPAQAKALWDDIDLNRNGKVSFVEFRDWASETLATQSLAQVAHSLGLSST